MATLEQLNPFRVGDWVRVLSAVDATDMLTLSAVYRVAEVHGDEAVVLEGADGFWNVDRFELAERANPSPTEDGEARHLTVALTYLAARDLSGAHLGRRITIATGATGPLVTAELTRLEHTEGIVRVTLADARPQQTAFTTAIANTFGTSENLNTYRLGAGSRVYLEPEAVTRLMTAGIHPAPDVIA